MYILLPEVLMFLSVTSIASIVTWGAPVSHCYLYCQYILWPEVLVFLFVTFIIRIVTWGFCFTLLLLLWVLGYMVLVFKFLPQFLSIKTSSSHVSFCYFHCQHCDRRCLCYVTIQFSQFYLYWQQVLSPLLPYFTLSALVCLHFQHCELRISCCTLLPLFSRLKCNQVTQLVCKDIRQQYTECPKSYRKSVLHLLK